MYFFSIFLSFVSFHNCYWLPHKWPGVKFSKYAPVFIRSFMKTKPALCASLSSFCVSTLFLGNVGGPGSPSDFVVASVGGPCPLFSFGCLTSPETWPTHFSYRDRSERIMKILFSHVPLIFLVLSSKIIEGFFVYFRGPCWDSCFVFPFLCSPEVPLLLRGSVYDSLHFTTWRWGLKLPLSFCQRIPNLKCVFKLPTSPRSPSCAFQREF